MTEEEITAAAERLYTIRFLLGEFEETRPYSDISYDKLDCKEHRELNLRAAQESIVLLHNKDIFMDMLTDSGVNAMSDEMQSAMLRADDAYAGSETFYRMVDKLEEIFGTGTAAVISPVGKVVDHGTEICFPSGMTEMGPVLKKLYDTLTGIQMGRIEAPAGWVHEIKVK